jgi:1-acyl-sn-glycerol-3-phosphate acyltransferase
VYTFLRGLMRLIVHVYLVGRFHTVERERFPRTGPLIVCSNHAATIDPPLVPAFLPRGDTWSMAKAEWFEKPFTRWLFSQYHAFPVVRNAPDRRGLRLAQGVLDRGGVLILYPEGTRGEHTGILQQAHAGAGFLARTSGQPVLPVALVGTNHVFPRGARWPLRRPMEIRFGPMFKVREKRSDGSRVSNQDAADAIMLAIARLLPEDMRGDYADLEGLEARLGDVIEPAA